jgi:methyltransferase (TIGR00027 family)
MAHAGSARFEGDSWDLASSVGATATMVAAARAMATRAEPALISDPYAEPLVRAVGVQLLTALASGELNLADVDDDARASLARMRDNMAARTKFFDDFFLEATGSGITQAVILASGLDARAYRLSWPAGTVVYEVDQPAVIEFKSRTLAELGVQPSTVRRAVAEDLRNDWPAALRASGFHPERPTAWSAEGLLGYLPPDAQDRLLDTITSLSAPGSRFATESAKTVDLAAEGRLRERMQAEGQRWRQYGLDLDLSQLIYFGDRNEAAPYLSEHGWQVTASSTQQLLASNGLPPLDENDSLAFPDMAYVSAARN